MTVVIVVVVNFVETMIIFKMTAMVTVGVRIVTHSYKYVAFQVYCVASTHNCCKYVMFMFM